MAIGHDLYYFAMVYKGGKRLGNFTKNLKKDKLFCMTKSRAILSGPLLTALIALAFCVWTALGNDVNICITTGCTLYQDFSIFGISLWWYGTAAFTILSFCALFGFSFAGRRLAALFLLGDTALLLLMLLTAPCINCLVVALFFCLSYLFFRNASLPQTQNGQGSGRSLLIWCWIFFFVINIGAVVRSQMEIWPILDESGEGRARMFFSPSCHYCTEGIDYLSGHVYMAFYPVAENETDIYRIARMIELLDKGLNISEALAKSADFTVPSFFSSLHPKFLLLHFRLLINKAHVFSAGSQGVPFFEYLGLPPEVRKQIENKATQGRLAGEEGSSSNSNEDGREYRDPTLPIDMGGQCGDLVPCPPTN